MFKIFFELNSCKNIPNKWKICKIAEKSNVINNKASTYSWLRSKYSNAPQFNVITVESDK